MATNAFGGIGLGQLGQEMSGFDSKDGIGSFLAAYGLQKSGAEDFLNKKLEPLGINFSKGKLGMVKPPDRFDVNPYLNTGMPASQPYAMPPTGFGEPEPVDHQDGVNYITESY